uniref:Chemosensory protein 22 n=1 Tax=Apocheima cinerarius TaxID=706528 RepID=A0A8T9ELS0_APOCI|nr:chemosensory protein 22 [Apocheima cinerarius]
MQVVVISLLLSSCLLHSTSSVPQLSDAQLEQTLNDKGTMQRHLRCALGEGPCDAMGRRLRTLAPLVLRGACPQCSPQETRHIRRTLAYVQRNYPWEWAKIVRQYG